MLFFALENVETQFIVTSLL